MKRPRQTIVYVLGGISILPWVYLASLICLLIPGLIAGQMLGWDMNPGPIILPLHLGTILITWILIVYFVAYTWKTRYVPEDKRALWTATLIFGNMFTTPVFWYHYVLRAAPEEIQPITSQPT